MDMKKLFKKIAIIVGIVVGVLVLIAVLLAMFFGTNSVKTEYSSGMMGGIAPMMYDSYAGEAVGLGAPSIAESYVTNNSVKRQAATDSAATVEKKVIKNGYLSVFVDDPTAAVLQIRQIAIDKKGFVDRADIYTETNGQVTGTVVIRVPNADFESTMEGVKGIAREVDRETVDATDVTEQYVDLEARLKNMKAEEAQYQSIMNQAVKIDDILNVAGRLADVRGRIEQVQGQLQYLSRQVDMSSITVNLTAYSDVKVFGLKWRPLVELKQALRGFFESLTNFVNMLIKLIFALPVILLYVVTFGLIGWGLWKLGKWAYRKLMR